MHLKRSLHRFKIYYLTALHAGKDSESAADEAMLQTKTEILALLESEPKLTDIDRQEMWGKCLEALTEWEMLLVNIPIDVTRLTPETIAAITENPDKPEPPGAGDAE
jgi:hypothetical protein